MYMKPSVAIALMGLTSTVTSIRINIDTHNTAVQSTGSLCAPEGGWNCLITGYQRCVAGAWSAIVPMAPGTECYPSGSNSDLNIGYATNASTPSPEPKPSSTTTASTSMSSTSISSSSKSSVSTISSTPMPTEVESNADRVSEFMKNAVFLSASVAIFIL